MPYRYTNIEYTEMVRVLARCGDNVSEACREYARLFPKVSKPSRVTMLHATQRLREFGQFQPECISSGRPSKYSERKKDKIREFVEENPAAGINETARRFNVSSNFVSSLLRNKKKHPMEDTDDDDDDVDHHHDHHPPVQEVTNPDMSARVEFCKWLLAEKPDILFTGEAIFGSVGFYNTQNEPQLEDRYSVNVWAGIVNSTLLGPVFLEKLDGETYKQFLTDILPGLLDEVPIALLHGMYYQHDGSPAHNSLSVRKILNKKYPGRLIGRGGAHEWPARSPDISPLGFFLWKRVRNLVYSRGEATSSDKLKDKIVQAFDKIKANEQELSRIGDQLINRCSLCVKRNGACFERFVRVTRNSDLNVNDSL